MARSGRSRPGRRDFGPSRVVWAEAVVLKEGIPPAASPPRGACEKFNISDTSPAPWTQTPTSTATSGAQPNIFYSPHPAGDSASCSDVRMATHTPRPQLRCSCSDGGETT